MIEPKIGPSIILRCCILFAAGILPVIFFIQGIFGSFVFTFSVPLIWQVVFLGKPFNSLGVRTNSIKSSITIGLLSGLILGLLGGNLLKFFGITGYAFNNLHSLQYSIGSLSIVFPLQKELGYRLLTMSNSPVGIGVYLIFSIFVIGLGEELFWRGFIQGKISGYLSVNASIWLTAILFALFHFYIFVILPFKSGIFFLILVAVSGAAWGYLFKYFNNLWPAAISHGITVFIIWKYYFFHSLT